MARRSSYVEAKETIVVNVGGKPAVYRDITVRNRRTGESVQILDTDNDPVEAEDPGTPYAFKAGEKVKRDHPAVKANPGAFTDATDDDDGPDAA